MSDAFAAADNANRMANLIRFGVVTEVVAGPPARARVEFEDGWVSDLLPVFQLSAGRVRTWSCPIEGEQVCVLSPSGEPTVGAILRGLARDTRPEPSAIDELTILGAWDDGAEDRYDEGEHFRKITVPADGTILLAVGALSIRIQDGKIKLDAGGSPIELTGSPITLTGPVNLGGTGGKAVARVGDPVSGGVIAAGSATVKAT